MSERSILPHPKLRVIWLGRVLQWEGLRCVKDCEAECWRDLRPALDIDYEKIVVVA